jgi:hypothetical protein
MLAVDSVLRPPANHTRAKMASGEQLPSDILSSKSQLFSDAAPECPDH